MDVEKESAFFGAETGILTVKELDGNGKLDAIYEGSEAANVSMRKASDNVKATSYTTSKEILVKLVEIFLPTGYPNSVSADYIDYQIYDSIQAFSSSIASLFANRCVLSAVGVGDESATSTSALFMKIIQETVGRLGTIVFAWKFGSALEPECKKYRYCADLVNDTAMIFDCLSPMFPGSKNTKVIMLCASGLLRSICGVMAGGSRAALTQHFTDPTKGSIADVNAKDQSQETVITLVGMLTGSVVVSMVEGEGLSMWITMLFLLTLHLWTNYQAVAHVVIRTLNRQRTNVVFSDILNTLPELESAGSKDADTHQSISRLLMTPRKVSHQERILERDGALRWYSSIRGGGDGIIGYGRFGKFGEVIAHIPRHEKLQAMISITKHHGYLISFSSLKNTGHVIVHIALMGGEEFKVGADVQGWVHALLIARKVSTSKTPIADGDLEVIRETEQQVSHLFDGLQIEKSLKLAGWELEKSAVLSHPVPLILLQKES